jgi:hypothetical protein
MSSFAAVTRSIKFLSRETFVSEIAIYYHPMWRRLILQGSHGDEYALMPFVRASAVDRACALARHEAEHALHLAMWHDRDSLRLRRPEILSLLDHSTFDGMRLSDEALRKQLVDGVSRTGRLLLIRDHHDAPSCGTDTHAPHTTENQVDSKWGGDSARWSQEKKLESMHTDLRPRVKGVLKGLAAQGFQPIIFYGWRSVKVQQEKLKRGYSHVTFSFHNATNRDGTPCAYAADVVDQRWYWKSDAEKNGYWIAVGAEAKANNLYWGGTWKHPDWAHVQLLPNTQLKHIRRACGY